jgi:hypothetical protein
MNRKIDHDENNVVEGEPKPLPVRLLVERLRLEAALRQQEINIVPFENLVVAPFPGFKTAVVVEEANDGMVAVHIRSILGEVLMVDQARELLASRECQDGSQKVDLLDDAMLTVAWTKEFEGAVDTAAVLEAFMAQVRVAFDTQRVVSEECYFSGESAEIIKQYEGRH